MTAADQPAPARLSSEMVDDIPVLVAEPDPASRNGRLALWMHFLSGNKEAMEPALLRLAEADYVAGGISMGGDLSVALAGIDPRVSRVAAVVATPDWSRPGMAKLDDPDTVIAQGEPTPYGEWLYHHLDPMTHLEHFARGPAIAFHLGSEDTHINGDNAAAFARALAGPAPRAAERVVVRVHAGLDHLGAGSDPGVQDSALAWLTGSD